MSISWRVAPNITDLTVAEWCVAGAGLLILIVVAVLLFRS